MMDLPELRTVDLGARSRTGVGGPNDTAFVLVHGLGASHLSWVQVAEGLAGLGHVFAIDLPGFGASPLAGRGAGLMDQRRTVSRFIGSVGADRVVLAGSSMGGALSILQGAVEPSSVAGIVLTNSVFPWRFGATPHPLILASFGMYATPGLGERFVSWRLHQMDPEKNVGLSLRVLAPIPRTSPRRRAALVDLARKTQGRSGRAELPPGARSMLRLGRRPRCTSGADTSPAGLLLHGRRTAGSSCIARRSWRGIRVARDILPDLGHIPQMGLKGGGSPRSRNGSPTRSTRSAASREVVERGLMPCEDVDVGTLSHRP